MQSGGHLYAKLDPPTRSREEELMGYGEPEYVGTLDLQVLWSKPVCCETAQRGGRKWKGRCLSFPTATLQMLLQSAPEDSEARFLLPNPKEAGSIWFATPMRSQTQVGAQVADLHPIPGRAVHTLRI